MAIPVSTLAKRLEDFCKRYNVPKQYHGSLSMLAEIAFIFDLELEPVMTLKPEVPTPPERAAHDGENSHPTFTGANMTERNFADVPANKSASYSLPQPIPPIICIKANDERALLTIKPDGTVTGEIEDASEAAKVFCESLRGIIQQLRSVVIEECLAALDDDEIAEAMDCNKVEKYDIHKSTLKLAKDAIRALSQEQTNG